jgi:hypothetical protein
MRLDMHLGGGQAFKRTADEDGDGQLAT